MRRKTLLLTGAVFVALPIAGYLSWWGMPLWKIFTYFRVPHTTFGYRYDLNHHRWHGPDTGDRFDPGKVIYQ